jgi:hypothetical protein
MSKRGPIFDWWMLPHFCFYVFVASTVESLAAPAWWVHATYWAASTVAWEVVEHFLERKYPEKWSHTFEHWANKAFVDPATNGIGVLVGVLGVMQFRGVLG